MTKTTTKIKIMKKSLIALLALGCVAMADQQEYNFTKDVMPSSTEAVTLVSKGSSAWTDLLWKNFNNNSVNAISNDIHSVPAIATADWVAIMQDGTQVPENKVTVSNNVLNIGNVANICLTYTFDVDSLISTYAPGTTDGVLKSLSIALTMSANGDTYVGVYSVKGSGTTSSVTSLSGLQSTKPSAGTPVAFAFEEEQLKEVDKLVVLFRSGSTSVDTISAMSATGKISATAPVPEPTTGSLSLLALAGLCARRRKK